MDIVEKAFNEKEIFKKIFNEAKECIGYYAADVFRDYNYDKYSFSKTLSVYPLTDDTFAVDFFCEDNMYFYSFPFSLKLIMYYYRYSDAKSFKDIVSLFRRNFIITDRKFKNGVQLSLKEIRNKYKLAKYYKEACSLKKSILIGVESIYGVEESEVVNPIEIKGRINSVLWGYNYFRFYQESNLPINAVSVNDEAFKKTSSFFELLDFYNIKVKKYQGVFRNYER